MLFILDLDGTIINSQNEHVNAFLKAIKNTGIYVEKDLSEKIKLNIGLPGKELLEKILPSENMVIINTILINVKQILFNEEFDKIKLLPNTVNFLEKASKEHVLALATSAPRIFTNKILEKFDLKKYFKLILTDEDVINHKPDSEIIDKIVKRLKFEKEDVIFFGDTIFDKKTAINAGVKFVGVTSVSVFKKELNKGETINTLGDYKL